MLPIGDENPTRLKPYANIVIILTCIATFLWQSSQNRNFFIATLYAYGVVPARIAMGSNLYSLVTNIFLHGGWSHLLGNMLFLWIFGDNIEDCCGHLRYVAFYIVSGILATLLWLFTAWGSPYPAVGASGAISGVMGAYFILYPKVRIRTLVGIGLFWRVVRVPASAMIGLWFVYQLVLAFVPVNAGVAYWAHIGGFVAGMVLARVIRPKLRKPSIIYGLERWE
ncbi:MAG: rhomboid family intramembrane serine protease [Candidatus Bathyarchaeota archaeon]|jgi:membrane associated rhomboid family serine protease